MVARDGLEILVTAVRHPERLGTVANDHLATGLIIGICQPNTRFVDVGAHIGSVSAAVARRDSSVRIVVIEAMPDKAASLRKRFPESEVHECAVGACEGTASFFVNTKLSGYSSLGRPREGGASDMREIQVAIKPLDGLIDPYQIDAIKIDVEGAELGVLRGAEAVVRCSRPTIMFESGPDQDDGLGYTKEALWQWFSDHEYGVYVPNRVAHNGEGLTQSGFIESHLYPRRTTNYIAIANERRTVTRDRARQLLASSLRE